MAIGEKQEKVTTEKEVDYTELNIDELIDTYLSLSTGEFWLKQHNTLQILSALFEEKFKADVEEKKKRFKEEGGNETEQGEHEEEKHVAEEGGNEQVEEGGEDDNQDVMDA